MDTQPLDASMFHAEGATAARGREPTGSNAKPPLSRASITAPLELLPHIPQHLWRHRAHTVSLGPRDEQWHPQTASCTAAGMRGHHRQRPSGPTLSFTVGDGQLGPSVKVLRHLVVARHRISGRKKPSPLFLEM